MSWFLLATPFGSTGKSAENLALKKIQSDVFQAGGKSQGEAHLIDVDKSKFKIGTLDQLVKLNDALVKVDHHLETIIKKIQKQAEEISDDLKLKVEADDDALDVPEYIKRFKWEDTKYPRSRALVDIAQIISEKMNSTDTEMKKHIDEYTQLKNQLYQYKKKEEGNFLSRDLGDIIYGKIDKKNFIHDSKFLKNVLIIVPKSKQDYFYNNYELVGEGIVPRSAKDLDTEDKDGNRLVRVIVMENSVDTFIIKCKQKIGFTAKIFEYNEEKYQKDLEEAKIIESKLNKLSGKMEKRCYYAYSDLISASIHLKVMRTYIDGVLRFGIPPKFLLTAAHAKNGHEKKVLKILTDIHADPKMKGMYGTKEEIGDTEDFFPFVYVSISTV